MSGARSRNVGWRIDYFLISASAASAIKKSLHPPRGSGQRPLSGGDRNLGFTANGFIFIVSNRVHSWFNCNNETVAFVHFARSRHGFAAGLMVSPGRPSWPPPRANSRAACRRRGADAARHGVVCVELVKRRANRGFFRLQALHDGRVHRGRRVVVHFCAGFSGGARAGGGAAAAGEIDGGHRRAHLASRRSWWSSRAWAYVFVVAGIWFTITPWKLRDILNWATATESRTRLLSGLRLAFALFGCCSA